MGRIGNLSGALVIAKVSIVIATAPVASSDSYECTVQEAWALKDEGTLEPVKSRQGFKVGDAFVIDRETGRIIGAAGLRNHGLFGQPEILHHGDAENSFRAVTVFSPLNPVSVIEIKVWISRHKPPFIYYHLGDVITGLCTAI